MIGISELFKRIQGIQAREVLLRTTVQQAIKKHTGADILLESVSFSSDSVILKNATGGLRSAIYIKKATILDEINQGQTVKKIVDIR